MRYYMASTTTEHMGIIPACNYKSIIPERITTTHIRSFITVTHIELLIFSLFLLANHNKYANELSNMCTRCRQTTWVTLMRSNTHIPSLMKICHCVLGLPRVYLQFGSRETSKLEESANKIMFKVPLNFFKPRVSPDSN